MDYCLDFLNDSCSVREDTCENGSHKIPAFINFLSQIGADNKIEINSLKEKVTQAEQNREEDRKVISCLIKVCSEQNSQISKI